MNNVLFGLIGLFMFAITGLGFAEVKELVDARAASEREVVADTAGTEGKIGVQAEVQRGGEPSVSYPLVSVVQKVVDAVDDVTIALSHDDDDDADDRGDDEKDDDEDDDDVDSKTRRSTSGTVATQKAQPAQAPVPQSVQMPNVKAYTMTDVAAHASSASCWSAIGDSVYDLTPFVTKHPGGQAAIKSLCGVDGTAAFSAQHGGQAKPESTLAQYKIGVVAN